MVAFGNSLKIDVNPSSHLQGTDLALVISYSTPPTLQATQFEACSKLSVAFTVIALLKGAE